MPSSTPTGEGRAALAALGYSDIVAILETKDLQMISADGTPTGYENLSIFAKLCDILRRERPVRIADA